ncbi:MAG: hypothetical protein WA532_14910 [Candidatus Korobacteraceae bacterium]
MGSYLGSDIGKLGSSVLAQGDQMERQEFVKVMQEVLDSLPEEFRIPIRNVAVLVEGLP